MLISFGETALNGLRWCCKSLWVLDRAVACASDYNELSNQDHVTKKDYLKVAFRLGSVVTDILIFKKDWEAENIAGDMRMQKTDLEKLENEIKELAKSAVKLEALGLASSSLRGACDGTWLDLETIMRMVFFAKKNSQLAKQDRDLNTGAVIGLTLVHFPLSARAIEYGDFENQKIGSAIEYKNLSYKDIPIIHHNNHVFIRNICPITLAPIRFPVFTTNPNGTIDIFERKAIVNWLYSSSTNPKNRQPLYLSDLSEERNIRQEIEDEMTKLGIPLS